MELKEPISCNIGKINDREVLDIFKQGSVVVHVISSPSFKEGDSVFGRIDRKRRIQLAQHHTATHIINGVSRELLGEHIWQAGAEKTLDKARLDITHYESLSQKLLNDIETRANEIIKEGLPVESQILKRDIAESQFGFRLYQGGAVPGRELRIVGINDLDVEACGGTHLHNTSEAGVIKVIGSTKIQDGIVRLEFASGNAAQNFIKEEIFGTVVAILEIIIDSEILNRDAKKILASNLEEIKSKSSKIIANKDFRNKLAFINILDIELSRCAQLFSVPPENLANTIKKFINEIKGIRSELKGYGGLPNLYSHFKPSDILYETCSHIFYDLWKNEKKKLALLKKEATKKRAETFDVVKVGEFEVFIKDLEGGPGDTLKTAKLFSGAKRIVVLFGLNERITIIATRGEADIHMGELVKELAEILGGRGGGRPDFGQGSGTDASKIKKAIDFALNSIRKSLEKVG
jgi:alanyl-tRNA synthetase